MDGAEESDGGTVAMKVQNKPLTSGADAVERRPPANGNPGSQSTGRTQRRKVVSQAADRIREFVRRKPKEPLTALLHHITEEALEAAYRRLKRTAAAGVDGVTWQDYGQGLDRKLHDLWQRVQRGTYRAVPVRRVNIPKPDGGERPLGIAALEDKIVQRALVDVVLNPIYEEEFLGFSYGFRPGRGAHDALDALAYVIERRKVSWIVDCDIRKYFDEINRDCLKQFLEHRIGDRRILRLIGRWLAAGVMEDGHWSDTGKGSPQGAILSPVLANVYLHYVLDLWLERKWRPQAARGEVYIIRYADDVVVATQYRADAERFLQDVQERFEQFGLSMHPEKTRLIEFGRFAEANRRKRGAGKPETFDFLGFTHYCRKTRKGRFGLGRKPIGKRMRRTLQALRVALRRRMHEDVWETGRWMGQVLRGWLNYYAVPTSSRSLQAFVYQMKRIWMRTLRRRSQKDRFPWDRLQRICDRLWPKPQIAHPWPAERFAVNTEGRSRMR